MGTPGRLRIREIITSIAAVMLFHLHVRSQRAFKSVTVWSGRDGWIVKVSHPHDKVRLPFSRYIWRTQKRCKSWGKKVKPVKPLLQVKLDDGSQICRQHTDIWSTTNRLSQSPSQKHIAEEELWWQSALCPKMFASCFTQEMRDTENDRNCNELENCEFIHIIINLFDSVLCFDCVQNGYNWVHLWWHDISACP